MLEAGPRARLEDALVRHATRAGAGWRPDAPSAQSVEQARAFVAAARRAHQAEPAEVDHYLREGVRASLAGDHEAARAILGAVLPPIAKGDIDLGQDELVDEVLSADLNDCVARYVAAVYLTTPGAERADAVFDALHAAPKLAYTRDPIATIERALGATLPELGEFLPAWVSRLERERPEPGAFWESDAERWLREAVGRRDGVAGLERIAKATKRPEAVRAWCDAATAAGDLARALGAYEGAAALLEPSAHGRGDVLDGAAFLALALGRDDAAAKFEAAWLGAPSLRRLVRWLLVDTPSGEAIRGRAEAVRTASPGLSPHLLGALHLLRGDIGAAAPLLAKAPGLGWSRGEHPGHLLFSTFVWLLGGAPEGSLRAELTARLTRPVADIFEAGERAYEAIATGARQNAVELARPSFLDALLRAEVGQRLTPDDRRAAQAALQAAAIARVEGVVEKTRRNHYGHAALLVACCVELESKGQKTITLAPWVEGLRQRTRRYPSFQAALQDALERARP